jgi:hypothetical protein
MRETAPNGEHARDGGSAALNRMGFDFLCYSGDIWLLRNALKASLDTLRAECRKAKRK